MTKTLHAIYDGQVLRPEEPLPIAANTRVRITIATDEAVKTSSASFLDTAAALNLEGPADWSTRFDEYLYGERAKSHE